MNIIEKLGMNTPDKITTVADVWKVYDLVGLSRPSIESLSFKESRILKKHLDDKNEMLEALIKQELSNAKWNAVSESIVKLIKKATGKTWAEIKELLK